MQQANMAGSTRAGASSPGNSISLSSTRRGLLTVGLALPVVSAAALLPVTPSCAATIAVERVAAHERAYPFGPNMDDPDRADEDAWIARYRTLMAAVVPALAAGPAGLAAKLRLALKEDRADIIVAVAAQLEAMA